MPRFFRFAAVGVAGFVVDSAVLYAAAWSGAGWYAGRLVSYLAAATFTWAANRRLTFRTATPPSLREWGSFLAANAIGGALNFAVYAALVAMSPLVAIHPVIGVGCGALAGLLVNFAISSRVLVSRS